MKKILLILLVLLSFPLVGCGNKEIKTYKYKDYSNGVEEEKTIEYYETTKKTNYVLIDTSAGNIIAELYPSIAPITVNNFKYLVSKNFYSNMIFHRVINNFMIQTGDPKGTGYGGSDEQIIGEFSSNGVSNSLLHTRGILSMARGDDKNSASSQFFIVQSTSPHLDGNYAAFGKVLAGLDIVDKIATVKTNDKDRPIIDQKLNRIVFIEIVK